MVISLVMPWRPAEDRVPIFDKLMAWYKKEMPDLQIITSDAGGDVFNLSASRNRGIEKAIGLGSDLLVVSDADVFLNKTSLLNALSNSYKHNVISAPYTRYHLAKREALLNTNKFESWYTTERPSLTEKKERLWPCSGALVIPKKIYDEIGGFDENYVGWGNEDQDYHKTYLNRYGRLFDYIEGDAYSIDHSKEKFKTEELTKQNKEYFQRKFR